MSLLNKHSLNCPNSGQNTNNTSAASLNNNSNSNCSQDSIDLSASPNEFQKQAKHSNAVDLSHDQNLSKLTQYNKYLASLNQLSPNSSNVSSFAAQLNHQLQINKNSANLDNNNNNIKQEVNSE
jgi:hypothetical protein